MTYKEASDHVIEYEKEMGLNVPKTNEVDLLRQYLIRDIRILSTLLKAPALAEVRACESYTTEELIECHQDYSRAYVNNVEQTLEVFERELDITKLVYVKALNFYFLDIYTQFGFGKEQILDFISKLTGISKEVLLALKEQGNFDLVKETSREISPWLKRIRQKETRRWIIWKKVVAAVVIIMLFFVWIHNIIQIYFSNLSI